MNEFQDQFPQTLPRPPKRQTSDDVVLPPDESMLSADDLLMGIPEPVTQQAAPVEESSDQSDDLLMSLPPEAMGDTEASMLPVEPEVTFGSASSESAILVDEPLELSIHYDNDAAQEQGLGRYAEADELNAVEANPVRFGVLDQQQFEASESAVVDLPESSAAPEKPQGFFEKHKPKLVIAVVILILFGLKVHQDGKKAELAAAAVPLIDPATTQVQSAAIADMQQGPADVSPLNPVSGMAEAGDAEAIFGEDLANEPVVPLPPPAGQPTEPVAPVGTDAAVPATAVEPIAAIQPIGVVEPVASETPPVAPVATEQAPVPSAEQIVAPADSQVAEGTETLKSDLARAEARLKEAEAEIAKLKGEAEKPNEAASKPVTKASAAKAPAVKPQREHRVVSTAKAKPQASRPAASAKRSDIQYIGSFLNGSNWGAHVVIAGNLYELSAGQRIASLKVDSVTGSGVTINGVNYR